MGKGQAKKAQAIAEGTQAWGQNIGQQTGKNLPILENTYTGALQGMTGGPSLGYLTAIPKNLMEEQINRQRQYVMNNVPPGVERETQLRNLEMQRNQLGTQINVMGVKDALDALDKLFWGGAQTQLAASGQSAGELIALSQLAAQRAAGYGSLFGGIAGAAIPTTVRVKNL